MSLGKTRWIRDLLILPIVVGVVLVFFQLAVDIYRTKEKVVSISVEGPFPLFEISELVKKSKIKFRFDYTYPTDEEPAAIEKKAPLPSMPNEPAPATGVKIRATTEMDDPQVYRVIVTNSGGLPIKELPISLVFEGATESFMLLSVEHKTMPPHEFGKIEEDFTNTKKPRLVYSLLNPKDRDEVAILTTEMAHLKAYAKAEGVHVVDGSAGGTQRHSLFTFFIIAVLSALMALLLQLVSNAIRRK